jgi:hypothetical protein
VFRDCNLWKFGLYSTELLEPLDDILDPDPDVEGLAASADVLGFSPPHSEDWRLASALTSAIWRSWSTLLLMMIVR